LASQARVTCAEKPVLGKIIRKEKTRREKKQIGANKERLIPFSLPEGIRYMVT
jgi:hypothetical protein